MYCCIFHQADVSGDGSIDFFEFVRVLRAAGSFATSEKWRLAYAQMANEIYLEARRKK